MNVPSKRKTLFSSVLIRDIVINYGRALLLSVIALLFADFLNREISQRFMFVFLGAVVLSSYWGGLGAGIFASLVSVILANFFLIAPVGSVLGNRDDYFVLAIFVVFSIFVTWIEARVTHSQHALQASKYQFEIILNGIADGVAAQDSTGQIVFANDAAARLNRFPSAKYMVETPIHELRQNYEVLSEDGQPVHFTSLPWYRAVTEGITSERLFRMRYLNTNDENWILIKASPVLNEEGKPFLAINIFRDFTENRRAEAERNRLMLLLDQQRRRIRNLLDNVPGIVWEAKFSPDKRGQEITFISNYSQKMLGYSAEELIQENNFWKKIIHPDDLHTASDHIKSTPDNGKSKETGLQFVTKDGMVIPLELGTNKSGRIIPAVEQQTTPEQTTNILQNHRPGTMEFRFITKTGKVVPVEAYSTILTNENQEIIGACGVFMDISERKQAETDLARYALELKRSNEELQQFATVASHDLQEPLRMVASYLQLIENRYSDKLDADGREFMRFAVDGATRMKGLIGDLLTFSRVETKQKDFTEVDCKAVVDQVCKMLNTTIEQNRARISTEALPKIKADERLIIQLFQNLIGNAIKYRSDREPEIQVSAVHRDGEWLFAVKDNGIGIEEQYWERIFTLFQRLHTQGKYPGTGIGLTICKKVVERHGGRMWVDSKIGQGSTFYFTIPSD